MKEQFRMRMLCFAVLRESEGGWDEANIKLLRSD